MTDVPEVEQSGLVRTLKDLFAGAAGGVAQVLLGMLNVHYGSSLCLRIREWFLDCVTCVLQNAVNICL